MDKKQNYADALVPWRVPALGRRESSQFHKGIDKFIACRIGESLDDLISPENRLRLIHGQSWGESGDKIPSHGKMKRRSAETAVKFESVAENDLNELVRFLTILSQSMSAAITSDIYATVSEAAEAVGNVVSQRDLGSPAKAFLEALKKIEFGVNSQGCVTLPSFHVPQDVAQRIIEDLNAQGPDFRAEVQRIKQEKAIAAMKREQDRLSRYQQ